MCARVAVHVTTKATCDEIAGWRGDELSVRVSVPPEGGKANAAVCKVVADALGVPKSRVSVARGHTSRHKQLEVQGVESEQMSALWGERGRT